MEGQGAWRSWFAGDHCIVSFPDRRVRAGSGVPHHPIADMFSLHDQQSRTRRYSIILQPEDSSATV
jgi:hypothetical protein